MSSDRAASGRALPCRRCGARFAIATLVGEVRCPYCGESQQLDAQAVAGLDAYREGVDRHLAAADQELDHVATWKATENSVGWKAMRFPLLIFMGLPVAMSLAMAVLNTREPLDSDTMAKLSVGLTVGVNVLAIGWVIAAFVKRSRTRGRGAERATHKVACPGCGAANPIAGGQRLTTCTHCGGALVPGQTLMSMGLDAARAAERAARIERHRAERRGMLKLMNYSRSARWVPLIGFAPMLLGLVIGTGVATAQLMRGEMDDAPVVIVMWGLLTVLVVVFVIWRAIRKNRHERLDASFEDLAMQLGPHSQSDTRVQLSIAWLDRYWPAAYETKHIYDGPFTRVATGEVHGYPVLIDLNLTQVDKWRGPRLHLMVASVPSLRGAPTDPARARALEHAVEHEGFVVKVGEAGVFARAPVKLVKDIFDTPDAAHAILPELVRLTQMAAALGHVPAPPIP